MNVCNTWRDSKRGGADRKIDGVCLPWAILPGSRNRATATTAIVSSREIRKNANTIGSWRTFPGATLSLVRQNSKILNCR